MSFLTNEQSYDSFCAGISSELDRLTRTFIDHYNITITG
jgi:hypothetical protein